MSNLKSELNDNADAVDLTNCDREPIHILGRVQSYGALLAVSSDWLINHASTNISDFLDVDAESIIGSPMSDVVSASATHDIRSKLQMLAGPDAVERIFGLSLDSSEALFDVAIHASGRSFIIEIEKHISVRHNDYTSYVRPMMERIGVAKDPQRLCDLAARQLRALTGFDRIMVYKFEENGCGTVVSESLKGSMEAFKGLRYPASDIPQQARALYKRNFLRIIADVDDEGAPIIPAKNPEGDPLDLSMSTTRAVSPIHMEYLRNMGVGASMSISILKRGELWGLFACHHNSPKTLPYTVRSAAELFGQLFAFMLDQRESDVERADQVQAQELHDRLMSQLAEGSTVAENLEAVLDAISAVIPYDGAIGWIDGKFTSIGQTPTREEFMGLAKFLNTTATSRVYTTQNLISAYSPAQSFSDRTAGVLALPVSRTPRDYIVLCRSEITSVVKWAGDPNKPVKVGNFGTRLTPRKSFETWQQVVHNHCLPWTESQCRSANALRITLIEVVLRMSAVTLQDRARAQESQEILIAELNHRVRNILNLIKGLIYQSKGHASSIEEFTEIVGGRVHALARAHDQITKENWSPSSLQEMIKVEALAYLDGDEGERVKIIGPDALLTPPAFTTLSLVIHELMTNSMKYGALTDSRGHVKITLTEHEDGALEINWRETGGPPIQSPPTRKGFGTTIIERSIPFELKGEAQVSFKMSGLEANFIVPPAFVPQFQKAKGKHLKKVNPVQAEATLSGSVLIVEDNIIISMDAEDIANELGAASVSVAASVDVALNEIEKNAFTFALLDVNLGMETSEPIAEVLVEKNIPFAFATGYGDASELTKRFKGVPVVQKPYEKSSIAHAIALIKPN